MDTELFLQQVDAHIEATKDRFQSLTDRGRKTMPIPFQGNINKASIATIGVNPSDTEFTEHPRKHAESISAWATYLENYFDAEATHKWFEPWKEALAKLDQAKTYESGDVIHLDLSPRPTRPMRYFQGCDARLFEEMLIEDAQWMIQIVNECKKIDLLLAAGCTRISYVNKFLIKYLGLQGIRTTGQEHQYSGYRVGQYTIALKNRQVRLWFCSKGPSYPYFRGQHPLAIAMEKHPPFLA